MKTSLAAVLLGLAVVGAHADPGKNESGKNHREWSHDRKGGHGHNRDKDRGDHRHGDKRHDDRHGHGHGRGDAHHDDHFHRHGHARVNIPHGHLPPPGECRIWYPNRPVGHQPPPVRCSTAHVPPGAWLIRHDGGGSRYRVVAYDDVRPGIVVQQGLFDWRDGILVFISLVP